MVSVGGFAMAAPSDLTQSPLMADVAGARAQRVASAVAAEQVSTLHRESVVAAAGAAAEQAQTVRTASVTVVPAQTLAKLDQATADLNRLLAAAGAPVAPTSPAPQMTPTPQTSPTPVPASTDPVTAAPTAQPTAGVAEPPPAASAATAPSAAPTPFLSASSAPADATSASAAVLDVLGAVPAQVEDAATKELRTTASRVVDLIAEVTQTVRDQEAAEEATAAADAETTLAAADQEATRAAQRVSLDSYANGRIPASALCELTFAAGAELRCDAAAAIEQLDVAYRGQFGTDLVISDSYRPYASQIACLRTKGSLCAVPGTSNHGLGKAVDLGGGAQSFGTAQHRWLLANAATYGWTLPTWARVGGSKPEPWHWEFVD
ncbi:MAG: M15 family metallopeptidase [Cellulomonas sp.]